VSTSRARRWSSARSPTAAKPADSFAEARQQAIDTFERDYLETLLATNEGKVAAAAQSAAMGRAYLYRLLHKHGLLPRQGDK